MARYDPEAIRRALPLIEVLAQYGVRLHKFRGPCPVCKTSDKSQALSVYGIDRQRWRCFACGEGGEVVNLIMAMESKTYREALEVCAGRAGLRPLPDGYVKPEPKPDPERERKRAVSSAWKWCASMRDVARCAVLDVASSPWDRTAAAEAIERFERLMDRLASDDRAEQDAALAECE